jgi:hypothetical protein
VHGAVLGAAAVVAGVVNGPLLILADTYYQARAYARDHNLWREGREWKFCRSIKDVRGRHGGRYVVLSIPDRERNWVQIQERREMLEILRLHGFEPLS